MTEEPLCFVAEHGIWRLYCRKAFPSAASALPARALLCQPPCCCHGACSPPLVLGAKQSSCVKVGEGTARSESREQSRHGCCLPTPPGCSPGGEVGGRLQLGLFARGKHRQQELGAEAGVHPRSSPLFDLFGLTPAPAFLSSLCVENTQDKRGFGLGWGLCEGSMTRLPKP